MKCGPFVIIPHCHIIALKENYTANKFKSDMLTMGLNVKIPSSYEIPFKISSITNMCHTIMLLNHNWVDGKISSPQQGTWCQSLNCNLSMEPPECCDIASGGGIKKRHRCLLLNVISGELVVTAVINLRMCRRDQICLSNTPVLSRVNLIWLVAHVVKSVQEKMLIPSWNYDSKGS